MQKRIFSVMLSFLMCLTSITPAFAYDLDSSGNSIENVEYQNTEDETNVYAEIGSEYKVTLPKTIVLSGIDKKASYYVKVEGDIAGDEIIKVIPDDSFYLYAKNKSKQLANVSQDMTIWHYTDFNTQATGQITAQTITAGKWLGTFNFNLNLEQSDDALMYNSLTTQKKTFEIVKGESEEINAYYMNADVTSKCTFKSMDEDILTVDDTGKITALASGKTNVKVYLDNPKMETSINVTAFSENIEYTASNYEGKYDNASHSISVNANEGTIYYSLDNINYSTTNPSFSAVGEYTVYFKIEEPNHKTIFNKRTVKISKANVNFTAPIAKELIFNNEEQELIIPASTSVGTILYKVNDGEYSQLIPTATNAGIYNIYCKVINDENYENIEEVFVSTTIKKAPGTVTVPDVKPLVYNKNGQQLINPITSSTGTVEYKLNDGNYSESIPVATNVGTYNIYYKVTGDENHEDIKESLITVSITKASNTTTLGSKQGAMITGNNITTSILNNNSDGIITVTSNDPSIATVELNEDKNSFTVTGVKGGTTSIIFKISETSNCEGITIEYPIIISTTVLQIDANGGTYEGSTDLVTFGVDEGKAYTKSFSYAGKVQELTIPYTGFYYIEAWGGKGGNDSSSGGNGGYLKGYAFLNKDEKIYINCGGAGANRATGTGGGYNGGANAGNAGNSGGGGGATTIATTNRGNLINYANYKEEVLMVAGGGSGGSSQSIGEGGTVLYAYTENNTTFPGDIINGASTSRLSSAFAQGEYSGSIDGGGGGGGWIGGKHGLDAAGNPAGGGASFINTAAGCIPIELVPSNNSSSGKATITYEQKSVAISNPVREGYKFTGWKIVGSGTYSYNTLSGKTMFNFEVGKNAKLVAQWEKID